MANPASVKRQRETACTITAPSGILGMLAAPAVARDTLMAALTDLPASAVAPLLERVSYHQLDGLAFRAVARLPRTAVDPWLRAVLKRRHQRRTAATLVQGMAVAEILHGLGARGIRAAVLGGLRSVESIYGDAGSRSIETHDLLVLPADRAIAAATLERLGLEPAGGGFVRGGLRVDLHVDAFDLRRRSRAAASPLPAEELMGRASPGTVAGAPAMLLSGEDELLLLAVDAFRRSFGRLIGIADLAHLVAAQGCALDWTKLQARAAACRTSRLLHSALDSTALLGVVPPGNAWRRSSIGRLERRFIPRPRRFRPFGPGGRIAAALSASGLGAALLRFGAALRSAPPTGVAAAAHPSLAARRNVVAIDALSPVHRHQEESVHGR